MIIENDKMVSIAYELKIDDENGKLIETVEESSPLKFIFGSGVLLAKFEENLAGKKAGELFNFTLAPNEAYGDYYKEDIVDLDIAIFQENGKINTNLIKQGNTLPMRDSQGRQLIGTILSVGEKTIKMDLNHPLAGKYLFFKGFITNVAEATEDDLKMFSPNGGCSGCGGSCDGGCC